MKQERGKSCAVFTVSMWIMGLFGLGQIIAVAFALKIQTPSPQIKIERVEIPILIEKESTTAPVTKKSEATLEDLLNRLDIDPEQITKDVILKSKTSSPNGLITPSKAPLDEQFQIPKDLQEKLTAARSYRQIGDLGRAMLTLQKLQSENPDSAPILYEVALAYEDLQLIADARKTYLKIFKLGFSKAGPYFRKANHKLTHGFGDSSQFLGKIYFGIVRPKFKNLEDGSRSILLSIPINVDPSISPDETDIKVEVDFYEQKGKKDISKIRRGDLIRREWLHKPADWANGEEILMVELSIPKPTEFEVGLSGEHKFFGYTIKLFYKSDPMDAAASPRSLFIIRKKQAEEFFPMPEENFLDGGLLPEKDFDPLFFDE